MAGRVGVALAAAVVSVAAAGTARGQQRDLWDAYGRVAGAHAAPSARAPSAPACELEGADRAHTPSARCMACHDGSAGAGIAFQMGHVERSMSHPVEVDYGAAVARDPRRYQPEASLPREVPLVNGKVACTSCHDGASPDPKRVVRFRPLCESCHDL